MVNPARESLVKTQRSRSTVATPGGDGLGDVIPPVGSARRLRIEPLPSFIAARRRCRRFGSGPAGRRGGR